MKAGGGRRSSQKTQSYARTVKRQHETIVIGNEFAQDQKLDTDLAVKAVFIALDNSRNGELDLKEFHQALQQMDIVLPVPVVRFLFEAIDTDNSGEITFQEFMDFINNDTRLEFQAEYVAEFHTSTIGLELILESDLKHDEKTSGLESEKSGGAKKKTRVFVANIYDDDARNYVLPNSEVIKIDDTPVAGKTTQEIKQLIDIKIKRSEKPCKITFKKTSNAKEKEKVAKMLGLMMGDEDWLVLSKHISREKLKYRVELLKRPKPLNIKTKHAPEGDGKARWSVWIHLTFEDETFSCLSKFVVSFVTLLIFVSTLAYVLQTLPSLRSKEIFDHIEAFVSICFTIEYAARILSSRNAWLFFCDPMSMIDFLAIIPWWVEISFGSAGSGSILRVIRVIRLARVFRLLKTPRLKQFLNIFTDTLIKSSSSAGLLLTILSLSIIIFASLMYFCEQGSQDPITGERVRSDDAPSPFISIPAGAWWCVVTMTTVGYGDMYPIETLGMVVATFAMFIGLFVIALPVIIIGGHFENTYKQYQDDQDRQKRLTKLKSNGTFDQSVEKFLDDINSTINAASGVQDVFVPFFTPEDKTAFVGEQLDTKDKIIQLLESGPEAIHFLPADVPEYKLFVLYEIFGKTYRSDQSNTDKFAKVKKCLKSKIQMI